MPTPGTIHPIADFEYGDIKSKGNYSQRAAAVAAWSDALLASHLGDVTSLIKSHVHQNGKLFKAVYTVSSMVGNAVTGVAVVGVYGHADCVDAFACDVSGSPWWHGTSPEVRAGGRLPP